MNPKLSAEVKLYGKKMLVLSALTLTIAPLVAVGNQHGMTARAASTGSGSQTNGLKVKVDDKALQTAVTQAKAAGVNVTQKATKIRSQRVVKRRKRKKILRRITTPKRQH
ncbi:hypothetical protein A1D15_1763 [Lactiplantibacillus plantarum]|uniref:Antigen I/II N-terminal domain-containing protein n=1 Tax=Lactiplantibacillus plantarum TaxID=1590 RepID=A0AAW3RMM7_LACPN|nr:hypothetical protein [Lactiplantibacillus plantarum]KZU93792.1 hypothetical protein A1D15_1763 [Lactiplantibacillus plantarum]KZV02922.1 hypothetical protein NAB1_1345 [Lactiplantibacillus plantarum]KZV05382.1 hypothetical protein NAB2_0674 [Lactiplantibacillus plantarum]